MNTWSSILGTMKNIAWTYMSNNMWYYYPLGIFTAFGFHNITLYWIFLYHNCAFSAFSLDFFLLSSLCVNILWDSFLSILSLHLSPFLYIQGSPCMILSFLFTPKTIPLALVLFITKT